MNPGKLMLFGMMLASLSQAAASEHELPKNNYLLLEAADDKPTDIEAVSEQANES